MSLDQQLIHEFLDAHKNHYVGKYKYHSSYRLSDYSYKYHYYMLDESFRKIDIFVEINIKDEIQFRFSEDLHELEQIYIVKDILKRLSMKLDYPSMLHYSLYDNFVKNALNIEVTLNPIDYINVLEYMKYHDRITQETIDKFYNEIFIPRLKHLMNQHHYQQFLESVILILKDILYEYEWDGVDFKYLDTEYQYHLYFIRKIIRMVYAKLDKFVDKAFDELKEAIEILCLNQRFSFMIMTDFGNLVLSHYNLTKKLIYSLKEDFILNDKDEEREGVNLTFSYIYYIFINDFEQYKAVLLKVLRLIIGNRLTFANSDLDLALGNSIIRTEGYEILLDLFHEDYNTFIFTCFPISSFPKKMISQIREELEGAIQFFAARMDNDRYRLSSFEQVSNINRLLMDNFGGWYK